MHLDRDFDWLADHHLERYLEAIGKSVLKLSQRRRLDRPHGRHFRAHTHVHRHDTISHGVSRSTHPHSHHGKLLISDKDFVEAFSKQSDLIPHDYDSSTSGESRKAAA